MSPSRSLATPRHRWLVLAALMVVTLACEAQWLVHASVARPAAAFYAGQFDPHSLFNIDFLALSYMLVFLVVAFPASWSINRWGLGIGVGIGAVLTIVGSIGKGLFAQSFGAQVGFQLVLAVAQPFLINAATTLARQWFPVAERATAGGLASLAQYLGFVVALALGPLLVQSNPTAPDYASGIQMLLLVFALLGTVAGVLALLLVRRGPLADREGPSSSFSASLKALLRSRDFRLTLLLFFFGLGILNAVTSLTDSIAASLGVKDSDGLLGIGLIGGGILGAIVVPLLSDHWKRRKLFLLLCMSMASPALGLLVFAPGGWYALAVVAMALLGFALMSAGPVGFQYAAEITAPIPEAASQGALLWVGQVSGLVLTAAMSATGAGAVVYWLGAFCLTFLGMAFFARGLTESPAVNTRGDTPPASVRPPTRGRA